jgi:hypothetical protein
VRRGRGQPTARVTAQPPPAFADGSVVGPAQQRQIGQISGTAVQPVEQMVGFAPGQRPRTAGEDTAAVADGQGGAVGGLDDPAGPPDI